MSVHINVVSRVLTAEFYRVNAMFFLLAMGFCFGFMSGREHAALAGLFVSSVPMVLIPIAVWIAYTIKVILYNNRETRTERNRFLDTLPLLPITGRLSVYLTVAFGQLAPIIAYGMFLITIGFDSRQPTVLVAALALIVLVGIATVAIHRALVHPEKEASTPWLVRKLDRFAAKPLAWIFAEGITRIQPGMIYATKIVTCLVIYGATHLYLYEDYDARLYSMAACAAFAANLALVYQYQRFEVIHLLMLRSLPLPFLVRVRSFIVTMTFLTFPEIAMLAANLPDVLGIQHYFFVIAFGMSMLILGYGALYVRDATFDAFTKWIFFTSMGLIVLILFGMPLLICAGVMAVAGIWLVKKNFYSFELNTQP